MKILDKGSFDFYDKDIEILRYILSNAEANITSRDKLGALDRRALKLINRMREGI